MACVFRRKGKWENKDGRIRSGKTSTYYARFDVDGKQYCISTGTTNKAEAEEELERLTALHRGQLRIEDQFKIVRQLLDAPLLDRETEQDRLDAKCKVLHDQLEPLVMDLLRQLPADEAESQRKQLAKKLLAAQQHKLWIADGWKTWKASPNKKRTPKKSTLSGYEAIWKRFNNWATSLGLEHVHDVQEEHAKDYATDLWQSHVSPATFNAHIKFLMSVFVLLETEAGLTENVWRRIIRKDRDQASKRNLTEAEIRTVFSRVQGNMRVMFAIGLFTGLRLGDVVNLRWDEIDHDRFKNEPKPGFIVVLPMKLQRRGKDKKVEMPIHAALRTVLDGHKRSAAGEFLFPDEREAYTANSAKITSPIQEFFEACGIKTTELATNGERRRAIVRVGFHSLRHSFVSLCAKAGAPQHVVQRLVGHGSPAMTEHYTHLDDQQRQDAIADLPMLMEPSAS